MCEFKTEQITKPVLFTSIPETGQAKSHKCFASVKKCSHRKPLQLLNHVQAHADNLQVPTKTSTEKESLQLSKVCLTLTFLLSKTWHIKQWSHTTLKQNEAKIGPILTDALNQILLLSVSAARYHSGCKDAMIGVLGIRRYTENNVVGDTCLKLPMFCINDCPSAWMFLFFFTQKLNPSQ